MRPCRMWKNASCKREVDRSRHERGRKTVTHSRLCLGSRLVPYASVEGLADAKTHADGDGDDEDDD